MLTALFFLVVGLVPNTAFSEGSDELCAIDGQYTYLYLCNDFVNNCGGFGGQERTHFAVYGCDASDRLNIAIKNSNEIVYMGFKGNPNDVAKIVFRIKDAAGNIVFDQRDMPLTGQIGYIANIAEARIGPNQIVGMGGYTAIEFSPGAAGTYYIEFNGQTNSGGIDVGNFNIDLIDITVYNTSTNTVEDGRLFSKGWQFIEDDGPWDTNSSTFYIYSADQVITSVEFDQLEGRAWLMYCNSTGCDDTGDFTQDRKSVNNDQAYFPEYDIFLNPPDQDLFPPTSTLGQIIEPWPTGYANCNDGSIDFVVNVDKEGFAEVTLDFDPPYTDITVNDNVSAGANTITWDGLDGSGNPVPNNISFGFFVTYINGLTNLPLFDIEDNPNGFRISLIDPPGDVPLVFWDDSNVGGTTNLTGCNSTPPNPGCHAFGDENNNTMNTWWYTASNSTATVTIVEERGPQLMTFTQTPPQEHCAGSSGIQFSVVPEINTEVYHWSYTGTGVTVTQSPTEAWVVTLDFDLNATPGDLQVYGTNANCNDPGPTASLPITIIPAANADAGDDETTCAGTPILLSTASITNESSIFWATVTAGADGSFDETSIQNPTYTPGPADNARGFVDLSVSAFSNAPCTSVATDQMTLTIDPSPTAFAGNDDNLCLGGSYTLASATTTHSAAQTWSVVTGDGTFDDATALNPEYTPGPGDLIAGTFTLQLAAHPLGVCSADATDQITVDIQPVPEADAGADAEICDIETYTLTGASVGFNTDQEWSHNGDGSFDDRFAVNPTYTPGANDILTGSVILTLTATPIAPCAADAVSTMTLSIQRSATADAGPDATICENDDLQLNGTVEFQNSILWSVPPTADGTFDDPTIVNPVYTPGPTDIINGSVEITLTAEATTPCAADAVSSLTLDIQPLAFADAGGDATICEGETYPIPALEANTASLLWTRTGDGTFSDATLIDPVYTPGPNDIINGSVQLTLTGQPIAPCSAEAISTMTLTIQHPVTASAGPATALICEGSDYPIPGTSEYASQLTWTTTGDGTFSDATIADPIYTPGAGDIAAGSVTMTLTADPIAPCATTITSDVVLNIQLACFADAGDDALSCEDVPYTITTADAGNYSNLIWTHNGLGTLADANTLNPTYTPAAGEFNTTVTLTLSTTAIPPCPDQTDFMELTILEGSYADAGSDEQACVGLPYDFANGSSPPQEFNGTTFLWTKVDPTVDPTGYIVDPTAVVPVYVVGDYDPGVTYPFDIEFNFEVLSAIRCRESDNMILTIEDYQPGAPLTPDQTICYNIVPAQMEVSAPTGGVGTYSYQWQSSTDNVTFTDIPGATALTYQSIPSLLQTTYFRNVQSCDCGSKETPVITVNVWDEFLAGAPAPDEGICFSNQPQLLVADPPTGGDGTYLYQWQSSTDNITFSDIPGATTLSYQPPLLTQTTYYRLRQTNTCALVFTPTTTISVLDEFIPGAVSADQLICYNTQPTPVSADPPTGGDGNYTYQWQSSTDDITYTDIAGATSLSYQPGLLTTPTYYHLNQICICGTVTTATIFVDVHPDYNVGSISGDQTICYNTVPTAILGTAPTGGDGTYTYQWQSSTNNVTFLDIPGATQIDYQSGALTTTTYFRQVQSSGSGCGIENTNTVTVTVYNEFLPGNATGNQTICFNTIPTLPLHGTVPTGADGIYSYQWEKSQAGGPYTPIGGATSLDYSEPNALQTTTNYRLMQTSGCGSIYTNIVTITVNDPPNVVAVSNISSVCVNNEVTFSGFSTDNVTWMWDFGDGTTSTDQNPPPHTYTIFGNYLVTLTVTDVIGCSNADTLMIDVVEPPIVDFSYAIDTCQKIIFTDESIAPAGYFLVDWYWELGDGTTDSGPTFRHQYPAGGVYTVTLTVTSEKDGDFCTNSTSLPVIVPNTPTIYYTWDPEPTCLMDTTFFYGASGTPITDWYWNFDDGHDTTGQYAGHVFDNPGTYDVILYITDTNLCQNSLSQQVTINPIPQVSMQIFDSPTCAQSMTTFQGTADTGIEFWYWDFGDGGISEDQNPVHSYTNGGTYTVTLTATDSAGCSATATGEIIVVPTPTADFSYSMSGCNLFAFTDNSTTPAGYQEYSWHWDFGDGFTSDVPDPVHTYATGGFFDVKLVFTSDSLGYQCSDSITKTVQAPNTPGATFTWAPNPAQAGDNIGFFATSGSTITNWAWDFADGGTATGQNATHTYTNPGDYDVSLTVTDVSGCTFETVIQVNVGGLPPVDFSWDNSCENTPIQFTTDATVTDVGAVAIYDWDFGDGTGSNNQDPLHTYLNANMYNVTLTIIDTLGYTNSVTHQVEVMPEPISMFSISSPNCENSETYFEDYSIALSGYLTTWEWDFGDGNTATINFPDDPDVSHIYPSTGTYTAMLTVTTSDGCQATSTQEVTITPSPIAQIDYDAGCMSGPISFHDVSSENGAGTIIARQWNFGDPASGSSNQSTQSDPTHLFSGPGTYEVTLSITSQSGCTDADTMEITITDAPEVDFTFTPACMHEPVSFTITDLTNLDQYFWDFGDGHTSQQPDPENTYDSPGDYQVTLTVQTTDGCTATQTQTVTVNPLPQAGFEYSEPTCVGDTIFFLNLSNSPNGAVVKWEWDFGDGNTETILAPNGGNTSHVYANDQSYDVTLTVTDSDSCQNTVTRTVISVASPVAEFNWEDACFGQPTQFYDLTNNTPDIGSWYWDFGDPLSGNTNTSTYQNPTHVFSSPGDYTVTLIVTNTQGCDDTITHDLSVSDAPDVSFTMSSDTLCANTQVSFAGTSTAQISTWYWDFGDGGYALTQNADYLYNAPGTYTVTLTVTDLAGCEASTSEQIVVKDAPLANFSYRNACLGDTTYFTDESYSQLGYIAGWEWDLGDGTTANIQNPTHLYATNDDFQVTLIATDNYGCADTIRQWVKVRTRPIAKIESFVQVCDPAGQVYFFDGSEPGADGNPIQTWEWNLNEGYYSTEIDPEYIYEITDTCYQVTLTVTDDNACYSTDTVEVCVFGQLEVEITADQVCLTQPTTFYANYLPENDSVASYSWNFHDGTPQIITYHDSIQHTFANPGLYNVELMAVDTNGCTAYASLEITIDSLPTPRFSYEAGACDTPMQFTDESLHGGNFIETWLWDFGDPLSTEPNTSNEQNPTHLYSPNDSSYQVKLIVTNFNGCTDSITQTVYTRACLIANFYVPDTINLCALTEVCFADSSVFLTQNGNITQWDWDFGDGNTDSYTSFQSHACHSYQDNQGGTYQVTLTVTGEIGTQTYTNTITKEVLIRPTPMAAIIVQNNCLGDTTFFTDGSETYSEPITTWRWDFGDTSTDADTAIVANPYYIYPEYENYLTELIVANRWGCTDTTTTEVTIFKPPTAEFSWAETCQGYYTYFTDESTADSAQITNYFWHFGDPYTMDSVSEEQNPYHIYDSIDSYTVTMQITDANFCRSQISHEIEIYPVPTALFTLTEDWEGRQGQVKLDNLSEGAIDYFWDFDDTYTTTEENPIHQYEYDSDPIYNLMLVATNTYGCPDTLIYPYELLFTGLYVPNAFSPSVADETFNTFKPVGINLSEYKLEVFSSWGNLVFSSTRLENGQVAEGWDGTYEGQPLPTGTYIWRITARFSDDSYWRGSNNGDGNLETHGTVTLIR